MARSRNDTNASGPAGKELALRPEENPDYEALRARIVAAVEPKDAVEELWVDDVAELSFEIKRLRHMRMRIVAIARIDALDALIRPVADLQTRPLVRSWSLGYDSQANEILSKMKLTSEDITAKAFELRLGEVERINGMIAQAEARRNVALREVERRRDTVAARLRAAAVIEDAEYQEVGLAPAVQQAGNGRSRS